MCATLLFGAQFARSFLSMASFSVFADRFLIGVMALAAAGVFFAATGLLVPYGAIMRTLSVVACAAAAIVLYVAVRAMLDGYRPARFFLLAWSALLVFIALGALRNFAIVPTHFLTVNGLHIGLALDIVLLSFALADRINTLKRATANAQAAMREREQVVEQLRHMAQHDPLTGLPNRLSMQQRLALAIEIAKRNRKKLAVMLVDLDDFKRINDTRGHPVRRPRAGRHRRPPALQRARVGHRGALRRRRIRGARGRTRPRPGCRPNRGEDRRHGERAALRGGRDWRTSAARSASASIRTTRKTRRA